MKRVSRSSAQWVEIFDQQARSGLTARAFCAQEGITLSSFYRWRQKLAPGSRAFVELVAPRTSWPSGVSIRLGVDLQIDLACGFDTASLRAALEVVRG